MGDWLQEEIYAIGWLAILAGIIYLIFRIISKKENEKKENEILRKYSDKCKDLPSYRMTYEQKEASDIFYKNWLEYDLVKEIKHNNSVLADAYEIGDIIKFQTNI
jgi:hypothetical protein